MARRLLVAAETFSTEQMLALGIVDAVYPPDSLHAAAQRYAESLIKLAPMAVTNMLEIIRQLERGNLNREQADALAKACSDSIDVQEGITAQREKRAPVFQNR
jgi:enoyl-CoA hydratase/carnithine racemase